MAKTDGIFLFKFCLLLPNLFSSSDQLETCCLKINGSWLNETRQCFSNISNDKSTWYGSYNNCARTAPYGFKGRLPVFDKQAVVNFLKKQSGNKTFWIGLRNLQRTSNESMSALSPGWKWYEGDSVVRENRWSPADTVSLNSVTETCMIVNLYEINAVLDDAPCNGSYSFHYFCEYIEDSSKNSCKPETTSTELPASTATAGYSIVQRFCSNSCGVYSHYTRSCFVRYKDKKTYQQSVDQCAGRLHERLQGRLAIIPNNKTLQLIENWIDLSDKTAIWVALKAVVSDSKNTSDWSWFDGVNPVAVSDSYWKSIILMNNNPVDNCAKYHPGSERDKYHGKLFWYNDYKCDESYHRLCEFFDDELKDYCNRINGSWYPVNGQCFKQLSTGELTWKGSYYKCASSAAPGFRGRLPVIENDYVLEHISMLTSGSQFWAGMRIDLSRVARPKSQNSEWKWYEGDTALEHLSPWFPSEVEIQDNKEDCILVVKPALKYNDAPCESYSSSYICEYVKGDFVDHSFYCNLITTTTITTSTATSTTPSTTVTTTTTKTTTETTKIQISTTLITDEQITSTAVYLLTTPPYPMSETKRVVAKVFQSIGCTFILSSLVFTLAVFLVLRDFSYERFLHMNQEIGLLIAHLLILSARDQTSFPVLCKGVSAMLQVAFIATFCFMMLEALQTYAIMTNVISSGGYFSRVQFFIIGWVVPAAFSVASVLLGHRHYTSNYSCWLNIGSSFSLTTIGPVAVLAAATMVMTEAATMIEFQPLPGHDVHQRSAAEANQKGMLVILPLNFAAWLVGYLAVYHANFAMYSLVSALNTSLGVAVFVFHSLGNPKVHALFKRHFPCCFGQQ